MKNKKIKFVKFIIFPMISMLATLLHGIIVYDYLSGISGTIMRLFALLCCTFVLLIYGFGMWTASNYIMND